MPKCKDKDPFEDLFDSYEEEDDDEDSDAEASEESEDDNDSDDDGDLERRERDDLARSTLSGADPELGEAGEETEVEYTEEESEEEL